MSRKIAPSFGYYFQDSIKNQYDDASQYNKYKQLKISRKTTKTNPRRQLTNYSNSSNNEYFPEKYKMAPSNYYENNSGSDNSSSSLNKLKVNRLNFKRNKVMTRSGKMSEQNSVNSSRPSNSSNQSLKSEFSKSLNRINTKIYQRQKQLQSKQIRVNEKIKDNQIVQLYRIIQYYQGKVQTMQSQLKKYQLALLKIGSACDEKSQHRAQVEELVKLYQEMRQDNENFNGRIQQKDYEIGLLNDKLRKNQIKLNFLRNFNSKQHAQSKIAKQNNQQKNQNNAQQNSKRTLKSTTSLLNNRSSYGNIQSKINRIQLNINYLRKQNSKLCKQIQQKNQKIQQYEDKMKEKHQQNYEINNQSVDKTCVKTTTKATEKYSRINRNVTNQEEILRNQRKSNSFKKQDNLNASYTKNDPLNRVVFLPRNMLNKISKPSLKSYAKINPLRQDLLLNNKEQNKTEEQMIIQKEVSKQLQQNFEKIKNQSIIEEQKDNFKLDNESSLKQSKQQNLQDKCEELFYRLQQKNKPKVFEKLRLQLMTEQISHQDAIAKILQEDIQPEVLEEDQYNLGSDEAQWLVEYISQARQQIKKKVNSHYDQIQQNQQQKQQKSNTLLEQFVKRVFPSYKDLTLKQQNNLKTHIYNSAMNRIEQFDQFLADRAQNNLNINEQFIDFEEYKAYFKSWGLLQSHLDVLSKAYYQMSRSLDKFNFVQTKNLILSWGTN